MTPGRATALAMTVTKGEDTMEVSANLEVDAAVVTRVMTSSKAEGAVQRTQTFRMEPGYTIEAHPVLFDGLHIAALDRTSPGPHRRPCLWLDLLTHEPHGLMAARPTVYVINRAALRLARDLRDHALGHGRGDGGEPAHRQECRAAG